MNPNNKTQYDPNKLLNAIRKEMGLKNDAALARVLNVAPPVISKFRHQRLPIGPTILIAMHEESGLEITELKRIGGMVKREHSKFSH